MLSGLVSGDSHISYIIYYLDLSSLLESYLSRQSTSTDCFQVVEYPNTWPSLTSYKYKQVEKK